MSNKEERPAAYWLDKKVYPSQDTGESVTVIYTPADPGELTTMAKLLFLDTNLGAINPWNKEAIEKNLKTHIEKILKTDDEEDKEELINNILENIKHKQTNENKELKNILNTNNNEENENEGLENILENILNTNNNEELENILNTNNNEENENNKLKNILEYINNKLSDKAINNMIVNHTIDMFFSRGLEKNKDNATKFQSKLRELKKFGDNKIETYPSEKKFKDKIAFAENLIMGNKNFKYTQGLVANQLKKEVKVDGKTIAVYERSGAPGYGTSETAAKKSMEMVKNSLGKNNKKYIQMLADPGSLFNLLSFLGKFLDKFFKSNANEVYTSKASSSNNSIISASLYSGRYRSSNEELNNIKWKKINVEEDNEISDETKKLINQFNKLNDLLEQAKKKEPNKNRALIIALNMALSGTVGALKQQPGFDLKYDQYDQYIAYCKSGKDRTGMIDDLTTAILLTVHDEIVNPEVQQKETELDESEKSAKYNKFIENTTDKFVNIIFNINKLSVGDLIAQANGDHARQRLLAMIPEVMKPHVDPLNKYKLALDDAITKRKSTPSLKKYGVNTSKLKDINDLINELQRMSKRHKDYGEKRKELSDKVMEKITTTKQSNDSNPSDPSPSP